MKKLYEELSDFLLQKVQDQSLNLTNKKYRLSLEDTAINVSIECSLNYRILENNTPELSGGMIF